MPFHNHAGLNISVWWKTNCINIISHFISHLCFSTASCSHSVFWGSDGADWYKNIKHTTKHYCLQQAREKYFLIKYFLIPSMASFLLEFYAFLKIVKTCRYPLIMFSIFNKLVLHMFIKHSFLLFLRMVITIYRCVWSSCIKYKVLSLNLEAIKCH